MNTEKWIKTKMSYNQNLNESDRWSSNCCKIICRGLPKKKKLKVFHMTDTVPKPSGVLAAKSCWHRKLFGIFMHLQWDNCYMSGGPVNMSKSWKTGACGGSSNTKRWSLGVSLNKWETSALVWTQNDSHKCESLTYLLLKIL